MPRHFYWGPPPPPGPHHPPPPPHLAPWGASAEMQELASLLQRYLSPADASWAASAIAHDPGPGRIHSLLLLALLERVDVLLERLAGGGQAGTERMESTS